MVNTMLATSCHQIQNRQINPAGAAPKRAYFVENRGLRLEEYQIATITNKRK
jgi:hypothetical protein